VRVSAIITQLVFEHALRIRVKAESSAGTTPVATPQSRSEATTPDTVSIRDVNVISENAGGSGEENEHTTASSNVKGRQREETPTAMSSNGDQEEPGKSSNLIGKMNNLVSTDLENLIDGRDFLLLGLSPPRLLWVHDSIMSSHPVLYFPLQVVLCVWFLYKILGWSAFVGMLAMIVLFPVPGLIATKIQKVQKETMKRVSIHRPICFISASVDLVADGCACADCY
jgi:hypothetical protein